MSVDTVLDAEHETFRNELASVSPDGRAPVGLRPQAVRAGSTGGARG